MKHAFLLETLNEQALAFEIVDLEPIQKHLRALRIRAEEEIVLLNGRGLVVQARCLSERPYRLKVLGYEQRERHFPQMTLVLAPSKNDALFQSIGQATEMGVSEFAFFFSAHCVQKKKDLERITERARRVIRAACEQCLQPFLPTVMTNALDDVSTLKTYDRVVVCDEFLSTEHFRGFERPTSFTGARKIALLVGPEGGWSSTERKDFQDQGFLRLSLGPTILRVPTATVAALQQLYLTSAI